MAKAKIRISIGRSGYVIVERRSSGGAFESRRAEFGRVRETVQEMAAHEPSEVCDARTLPARWMSADKVLG